MQLTAQRGLDNRSHNLKGARMSGML
jgi:hypothetical protein